MSRFALLSLVLAVAGLAGCGRDAPLDGPTKTVDMAPVAPKPTALDKAAPIEGQVEAPGKAAIRDYEQRVLDARRTVDITLYGATWCPSCKQARAWLDANGMAYNERDVDRSEDASRTMRKLNPAGTIPVIDVEGEVVVGFAPDAVDRAIRRRAERRVKMN
jgi:glutaredoxin